MDEQAPRRQTKVLDKQRLKSFLLGGAAGILAGILLAPRSGRELRGSIRDRAGEARERSRESLFEAQERMQERISEAREGPDRRPETEPTADVGPTEAAPSRGLLRSGVLRDVAEKGPGGRREVGGAPEEGSRNPRPPQGEPRPSPGRRRW